MTHLNIPPSEVVFVQRIPPPGHKKPYYGSKDKRLFMTKRHAATFISGSSVLSGYYTYKAWVLKPGYDWEPITIEELLDAS